MSEDASIRNQLLDALLAQIEEDTYPSATTMDIVQQLLPPDRHQEYAGILLDKISGERFPSINLIRRVALYAA